MPHLDASALTDETSGLEFLRSVLDVPADHAIPSGAFDPARRIAAMRASAEASGEPARPFGASLGCEASLACEPA